MKKTYSKPQIVFDSFELSQSIAVGCEYISHHTEDTCAYESALGNVFLEGVAACERKEVDGGNNGICYHVPADNSNLFSS